MESLNVFARRLLPALLVLPLVVACSPMLYGEKKQPITDRDSPIVMSGFTLLPPSKGQWYLAYHDYYDLVLGKQPRQTAQGELTVVAKARTRRYEEKGSPEAFHEFIKQEFLVVDEGGRYVNSQVESQLIEHEGAVCVRFVWTMDDRGVPRHPSEVFTIHANGLVCKHPVDGSLLVAVDYSQRTPPGIFPVDIAEEGEAFLKSLHFTELAK